MKKPPKLDEENRSIGLKLSAGGEKPLKPNEENDGGKSDAD